MEINLTDILQGIAKGTISLSEIAKMLDEAAQTSQSEQPPKPLTWGEPEKRRFLYGVSHAILYPQTDCGDYGAGIAWQGIIRIAESPEGCELKKLYADGMLYAGMRGDERYHAEIEAYTYPDAFAACDGSAQPVQGIYIGQQRRTKFGLCWRTEIGSANDEHAGYCIHLAYGLCASPTEKAHDTVNESPEEQTFTWKAESFPEQAIGRETTAKIQFDSTKLTPTRMALLSDLLYGETETKMPLPCDLLNILAYAYANDTIGRQQIFSETDYVKDGTVYRGAPAPTICVDDESALNELAQVCRPCTVAIRYDMARMWQLDANATWVRMI